MLLTLATERVPFVSEDGRMTIDSLDKGFAEMTLRFGFAEAPSVPEALQVHSDVFPVVVAETSFFVGRENPLPTTRPDLSVWREKLYLLLTRNAVRPRPTFRSRPNGLSN